MGVLLYFLQGGNSYFPLLTLGWSLGSGGVEPVGSAEGSEPAGGGHSWLLGGVSPERRQPQGCPRPAQQRGDRAAELLLSQALSSHRKGDSRGFLSQTGVPTSQRRELSQPQDRDTQQQRPRREGRCLDRGGGGGCRWATDVGKAPPV